MADSNITKNALAVSMKKLMEKKPFSKISVGDICEDCGMNRKSFYYHFRDKYDLVNWIFYVDFIERMDWSSCRNEWDMLEALCSHFYGERLFYQNALQVEGQNSFREYFCGMLRPVLMLLTQNLVEEGRKKDFYIAFLCEGVLGELVYWLREGSKITPEEFVEDLHDISLGLARKIIAEEAGKPGVGLLSPAHFRRAGLGADRQTAELPRAVLVHDRAAHHLSERFGCFFGQQPPGRLRFRFIDRLARAGNFLHEIRLRRLSAVCDHAHKAQELDRRDLVGILADPGPGDAAVVRV